MCRPPGRLAPNRDGVLSRLIEDPCGLQVSCSFRCRNTLLKAKDKVKHEAEQCPKRPVACPNKCTERPTAEQLKDHMNNRCVHRYVPSGTCPAPSPQVSC
jgi:hypothetical protein